jgi:hypothetical protein
MPATMPPSRHDGIHPNALGGILKRKPDGELSLIRPIRARIKATSNCNHLSAVKAKIFRMFLNYQRF